MDVVEDDCTVVAALMPNKSVLGLENDCMMLTALNPVNETKLKLKHEKCVEDDCTLVSALMLYESERLCRMKVSYIWRTITW